MNSGEKNLTCFHSNRVGQESHPMIGVARFAANVHERLSSFK